MGIYSGLSIHFNTQLKYGQYLLDDFHGFIENISQNSTHSKICFNFDPCFAALYRSRRADVRPFKARLKWEKSS